MPENRRGGERRMYPTRLILLLVLTASLVLPLSGRAFADEAEPELEILFFQAGKADAILLRTQNAVVLIDCGLKGFGQTILSELRAHGIEKIDVLILTHFDKDHVGGAAKVINNMEVESVLQSNYPKNSEEYEKYLKALRKAGIEPVTVRYGFEFMLDGVQFSVDPPAQEQYRDDPSNNSSLIVTVRHGENTFLLTGDAETERLQEFLRTDVPACTVLKLPHHGDWDPLLGYLLRATEPEHIVVTCEGETPEDLRTLGVLNASGCRVWVTGHAPVRIRSDGAAVEVSYEE